MYIEQEMFKIHFKRQNKIQVKIFLEIEHMNTFLIICEHACQPRTPISGLNEIFKYLADS